MKKVLSLVLAFAMILGSFGFVFANQYPDVKDTEYYSEPVNVLSGLGVVGGFPDGTFGTGKSITRAELATMLINCLGIPVSGKTATPFSDVPASHWASGYIKYAANMGYVAGYSDGTFKPNKEVSYDEALTMIVASLGYTAEGLTGSWPGNFVNAARGLGLLSICKKTGSAAATREDVCCFLYKALTAPIGRTNKDGEFVPSTPADTMIDRLGATPYDGGAEFVVDGSEPANINLKEYIGQKITAYANDDGDIIAIKEVFTTIVENTTYAKLDKAYKNLADVKGQTAKSFSNGEANTGTDKLANWSGASVKDEPITVALKTSGKNIKEVHSIQVWEVTIQDFAADDVQEEINDDHTLLGKDFAEDDDEIDMNSFALLGRDSLADIAEDDVVYVYVGPNSHTITKVEVGTETVEGKITAMTSNEDQITVAGKKYAFSEFITTANRAELKGFMKDGVSCTFFLDYAGEIYAYEKDKDETAKGYAVVLNKWIETVKGKDSYHTELFLSDGKSADYEVETLTIYNAIPMTSGDPTTAGDLIKFEKSSKDIVTKVEVVDSANENQTWDVSKKGLVGSNKLTSSSIVFKFNGNDADDAANYNVVAASTLFGNKSEHVDFFVDSGSIKAALVKGATGAGSDDIAFIVTDGNYTVNGQMFKVLYQGKVQDMEFDTTAGAVLDKFGTLTVDADGLVTKFTPESLQPTPVLDPLVSGEKTAVDGSIFTGSDNANYELDDDVYVYVYDVSDEEWTAGKTSSMVGKTNKFNAIELYDLDGDNKYDLVFVRLP